MYYPVPLIRTQSDLIHRQPPFVPSHKKGREPGGATAGLRLVHQVQIRASIAPARTSTLNIGGELVKLVQLRNEKRPRNGGLFSLCGLFRPELSGSNL
jgi:hypothetical protein